MATQHSDDARSMARRDLGIVQEETRRMDLLRRMHGVPQLLAIWGAVIIAGNAIWLVFPIERILPWIEMAWVGLIGLAILLSGWMEWHNRLRAVEAWRMWGLMLLLLAHGWGVARMVDFADTRQAAVYIVAFILVGWALTALIFRARLGFAANLVMLSMVYGGYLLTDSTETLLVWLMAGVGGGTWAVALVLTWWGRRLKRRSGDWAEAGEPDS